MKKTFLKSYLLIAIIDAIASRFYIDLLGGDFWFSASVFILPVFYLFRRNLNPLIGAGVIAIIGTLFRTYLSLLASVDLQTALFMELPVIAFDMTYGLLYYVLLYRQRDYSRISWLVVIILADITANIAELIARSGPSAVVVAMKTIVTIAIFRGFLSLALALSVSFYRLLVIKEEHDAQYKKMLLELANLDSELYFVDSYMNHVEQVMVSAYEVYEESQQANHNQLSQKSLSLAKDVHEIKKNYLRIHEGLRRLSVNTMLEEEITYSSLVGILVKSFERVCWDKHIQMMVHNELDFSVKKSYKLTSILRNLLMNSIEELEKTDGPRRIVLEMIHRGKDIEITITDTGNGIQLKDIAHIYDVGFTTKFEGDNGQVKRGLGLSIVKELVEEEYGGEIKVKTAPQEGTSFILTLPKERVII